MQLPPPQSSVQTQDPEILLSQKQDEGVQLLGLSIQR